MFLVDKTTMTAPASVQTFHLEYSEGWKRYVENKKNKQKGDTVKQPNDKKWTDESIRKPLYDLFEANCGYCGCFTHIDETQKKNRYFGHVDHFVPKSIDGDLVYSWDNYVWSCKDCNEKKHEFYEDPFILNPTNSTEVSFVEFSKSEGKFFLSSNYSQDPRIIKLYNNTNERTLINLDSKAQERRTLIEDVLFMLRMCKRMNGVEDNSVYEDIKKRLKSKVNENLNFKKILKFIIADYFSNEPNHSLTLTELYP